MSRFVILIWKAQRKQKPILFGLWLAILCLSALTFSFAQAGKAYPDLTFLVSPLEQDMDAGPHIPIDAETGYAAKAENYVSGTEYRDETLHVVIETDRYRGTDIWIARVEIAHPSQLRSAFVGSYGGQMTALAATAAKRVNAVVAINADYHSFGNSGIILRQGHLFRNRPDGTADILFIDINGDFHTLVGATKESFLKTYDALGGAWDSGGNIVNIFTFGPVLVKNGASVHDSFTHDHTAQNKPAQRAIIAQTGPLSYLLLASEGPESPNSYGLTLKQLEKYLIELGCDTAYNLDGGSSTSLVFCHEKINSPDTKIRPIADIIYFATACTDGEA